jgi:hypothetical protein
MDAWRNKCQCQKPAGTRTPVSIKFIHLICLPFPLKHHFRKQKRNIFIVKHRFRKKNHFVSLTAGKWYW